MRSGTISLDPELETLLQEVAADPDSRLLKAERKREYRALLSNPAPVSASSDVLSKPEAYLLEFYREELAWLLVEACSVAFRTDSGFGWVLHRVRSDHQPQPLPNAPRLRSRATALALNAPRSSALSTLQECMAVSPTRRVTLQDVSLASLEVGPSEEAMCYLAHALINRSDLSAAREVCSRLLGNPLKPAARASALSAVGRIAFDSGDYRSAARAYEDILQTDSSRHSAIPLWLVNAALAGDQRGMTVAMSEANRFVTPKGPTMTQFRATFDAVRDQLGRAGIEALKSCSTLAAEQGETSAQVIHEAIG